MDKKRRLIGMGAPRDRRLQFVESNEGSGKILSYKSKKLAESGFKVSGFYTGASVDTYLRDNYSEHLVESKYRPGHLYVSSEGWREFLEAVEVEITIKEV